MAEVKIAILGLGPAGEALMPFIDAHPATSLTAVADSALEPLRRHEAREGVARLSSVEAVAAHPDIDAVYVATPTPSHTHLVVALANAGKHVIVEKPMASTLADADRMVTAASAAGTTLMVGHSHSYEAPIRAMRDVIERGDLGPVRAMNGWNFTDWFYRPRHPDELDPATGGGVALRQGSHHVDTIRYLGGGELKSVRAVTGDWDSDRPGQGAYHAFVEFRGGEVATLAYSGYDHFSSTELTFGIGETGQSQTLQHASARSALAEAGRSETALKDDEDSPQRQLLVSGDKQPFFGLLVVSCEHGDMRVTPTGIRLYGDHRVEEVDLRDQPVGRTAMLDELVAAVHGEERPTHDGEWGLANLEACLAITESSRDRLNIELSRQVPLRR